MRLVVAGDGPMRAPWERMAGTHTEFVGPVTEAAAAELLSGCSAFVFCAEEDFGIAPVEANAHGVPVVAFGRGGIRETMTDGETAIFFHEQSVPALCEAIMRCNDRTWNTDVLVANASRFSPQHFREGMRRELTDALARAGASA
jgi:glycosyltransferase involved in cell wall biosynthesis